jgi:hypothetical protein
MKHTNYIILFILIIFLVSCRKNNTEDVNFTVVTSDTTFRVSDSVRFAFTGNPDIISFYSGEPGSNYDFKNRVSKEGGTLNFSFQTRVDNVDGFTALAAGALKVLVSTNFKGTYSTSSDPLIAGSADSAMTNSATWTDITSRFFIPATGVTNTFYNSNEAEISDLVTSSSAPINIAFKYIAPTTPALGANGITIGSLLLYSTFPDGTTTNFNVVPAASGGVSAIWKPVRAANVANSWTFSSTQLKYISTLATAFSEDWAVSAPFFPKIAIPDKARTLKNISNNPLVNYAYKFSTPGRYKLVFVGSNNRVNEQKEVIKEITLTIKP